MPQTAMQQALLEGKVQAIVTYPPVSIDALKEKSHKAIFTSKEIPGEVIDVLVFDSSVISSRQDDIRKFILAYNEAVEFSSSNPAEAYQIMAEREGISAQDFETAVSQDLLILSFQQQAKIFEANGTLYKAINEVQNVLFENSEISTKRAAASFIDDSFVYKQ
jgi:NitT/TauT family transport system substrate-binding protein